MLQGMECFLFLSCQSVTEFYLPFYLKAVSGEAMDETFGIKKQRNEEKIEFAFSEKDSKHPEYLVSCPLAVVPFVRRNYDIGTRYH